MRKGVSFPFLSAIKTLKTINMKTGSGEPLIASATAFA